MAVGGRGSIGGSGQKGRVGRATVSWFRLCRLGVDAMITGLFD